jgi:hypothetical protein
MQFLRKLALGLSLALFIPLLLTLPSFVSLNQTIIKPEFVKETLVEAKVYEGLSSYIVEQASKNQETADNTIIIASVQKAATPTELQKIVEPPIDATYKWLNNPDEKFDVQVSLAPLKASFVKAMEENTQAKITGLPRCTSRAVTTTDPYEMTCLPQGVTVEQVMQQARAEIEQNQNLLGENETIALTKETGAPQPPTEGAAPENPAEKVETPTIDTNQFKIYAKVYNWVKVGTPIVAILTLLAALGIMLLSSPRYKGLRRSGVMFIISGVLLLVTSLGTALILRSALPVPATEDSLSAAGRKAAELVANEVIAINRAFTIGYLVLGTALVIAGVVLGKKATGSAAPAPIEKENMVPEDKKLADKPAEKAEQNSNTDKPNP